MDIEPFFCNLNSMDAVQRQRYQMITARLGAAVQQIQELPDGYALRLPSGAETLLLAVEFVTLESLCCPFLQFNLEVAPHRGPVWLRLTGPEGVKPFLQAEMGLE
jgi:hypothetical protein